MRGHLNVKFFNKFFFFSEVFSLKDLTKVSLGFPGFPQPVQRNTTIIPQPRFNKVLLVYITVLSSCGSSRKTNSAFRESYVYWTVHHLDS